MLTGWGFWYRRFVRSSAGQSGICSVFDRATWTVLIVTMLGILLAMTPFGKLRNIGSL
ncbi:MAG: hypothetical protein ACLSG5_10570 [Oscillospiraceae bacterium]